MPGSVGGFARMLLCCSCSLASWAVFPTAPANAEEPLPESVGRVDDLLARGIQSRQEGEDGKALELFRQASALDPGNARVLAHLGATYHALGRWVLAHTYLTRALEQREDGYIQRHRAELEEALATVGGHIGFFEVNGAPDGAEALINGQLVATLPMSRPVPVIVGSYLLEVRFKGHYTLGRPITVSQRMLTREEVELAPHRLGAAPEASAAAVPRPAVDDEPSTGAAPWVPWLLGGLSATATVTSVIAWQRREHYAERWNDDSACVGIGVSREERCGDELDRGKQAETVLWVSGVAAGVFAAGAVITAIGWSDDAPAQTAAVRCAPSWGGASCFGSF